MLESSPLNNTWGRGKTARVSSVASIPQLCFPSGPFAKLEKRSGREPGCRAELGILLVWKFSDSSEQWLSCLLLGTASVQCMWPPNICDVEGACRHTL